MYKLSPEDKKHLNTLLTPSWLSGLIALLVGLILSVGVIGAFSVNNSTVQQQLAAWQQDAPQKPLTTPDQIVEAEQKPGLQKTWPLVIIWSFVGLATYTIAASIMHALSEAIALKKSLNYVHTRKRSVLQVAAERIALRLVAAVTLAIFVSLFIGKVFPYAISASHASAADIFSVEGILYGSLAFAVVVISLHVQTIFLRLTLGKIRIFS